jgi:transcriptional regulator with XRE-family HTH domain
MVIRSHEGTTELGLAIRSRRVELGSTIEEMSRAAGVGSETWRRYEAGASIRVDK